MTTGGIKQTFPLNNNKVDDASSTCYCVPSTCFICVQYAPLLYDVELDTTVLGKMEQQCQQNFRDIGILISNRGASSVFHHVEGRKILVHNRRFFPVCLLSSNKGFF